MGRLKLVIKNIAGDPVLNRLQLIVSAPFNIQQKIERFIQSLNLSNAMMMQLMSIESFQRTTNDIKNEYPMNPL